MPINEVTPRLREGGRIRIGMEVEATKRDGSATTRPQSIDTFRFTSEDKESLTAIAARYGGEVVESVGRLEGEAWEVVTDASSVDVLWPASDATFSQWMELWSGGGCQRRCDGTRETLADVPCICAAEGQDRENRACDPHTRLSVILVGLESIGVWRLDTQSWYAAAELLGVTELAKGVGGLVPGRLLLRQETKKVPGEKTKHFVVPALDLRIQPVAIASGARPPAVSAARPAIQQAGPGGGKCSEAQRQDLRTAFVAAGFDSPTNRKQFLDDITGRDIPDMRDLTEDEASLAFLGLQNLAKPSATEAIDAPSYAPGEEPF